MKKMIAMLLTPVMCLSLAACGSSTSSTSGETKADETKAAAAESTSAAGTTPTYDTVTLKLSHHNAVDQPIHEALTEWADMLKEKSDGAITIDIYPAASLYNSSDAEDAVKLGTLDMCLGDTSQLSNSMSAYTLTCLPFLFDSYDTAGEVLYGDVGKKLDSMAEEQLGIVPLGWTWNGFRNMCTKTPIRSVADCKNYKLRSPGAQIYLDTFETLGMSPTVVPWSEAYTAMQSGMVDGIESGLEAFYTQGFYTLGNNICLSNHMISIIGPIINADKWNSLSPDTQKLMKDCWAECQKELNQKVMDGEDSYEQKLKDAGCTITEFENRQELIDLFTPYWTKSAEDGGYTDLLNDALAIVNKK